jgi:hypothetical protein
MTNQSYCRWLRIPLTGEILPIFLSVPCHNLDSQRHLFLPFCGLRRKVSVPFVHIGRIVGYHCSHFSIDKHNTDGHFTVITGHLHFQIVHEFDISISK